MRRAVVISGLSLLSAAGIFAQSGRVQSAPTPTPDDTIRVHSEEIKLNVLAFDENGRFFRDVTPSDLVISENNILHQPSSVRRVPANVLILMDTGGELRSVKSLDKTRKAAQTVVDTLRPGDSIAIMQYSDKPEIVQEWTSDKAAATQAIARTNFGRRDAYVDALKMARNFMVRSGLDNKHLILITDGTDSGGRGSDKFDALQALLATDITVHVLSYTSMEAVSIEPRTKGTSNSPPPKAMPDEISATLPNGVKPTGVKVGPTINLDRTLINKLKSRKTDLETSEKQLEKIAENTNGEFVLPASPDEMIEKARLISKMIDASYVVTYMPKVPVVETRGIAERNIEVTSKREGLIVQARRKLVIDTSK
ncbi:MAG: VWA domain-containing protein [Acidobacteria bacterium]|nr:VWA domain-containing protein [Acidobacteriota bacterium]